MVISFRLLRLREWRFNGVVRGYCPLFILFIKGKGRIRNRAGVRDEIYQVTVGNYKKSFRPDFKRVGKFKDDRIRKLLSQK